MSTTQYPETDCEHCSESFEAGYNEEYCSSECYFTAKGEGLIRQIQSDHTHCSTCYGRIKVIEKPPQETIDKLKVYNGFESSQSLVGYQYHTPRVERGSGFIYCRCGNVDHHTESEEIRDVDMIEVIMNLWALLLTYYEKGIFGDNQPDREILLDTLKESNMDFELSIGKAVYGKH